MIQFAVADGRARLLGPVQVAHLWVQDRLGDLVPAGIYATGSVIGPVVLVDDEDGERVAVVSVGFDSLRPPVDGTSLLARDEFVASPLHDGATEQNPVPPQRPHADHLPAHPLTPGPPPPLPPRS